MVDTRFKIDLTKTFDHLNHAPIIEAVIEIRALAQSNWEESTVPPFLRAALPEYPIVHSMNAFHQEIVLGSETDARGTRQELGWDGLRLQSADKLHVAQFNKGGFVFSRLHPYDTFEQLEEEAMRLWQLHIQVAKPNQIERLGVRFVNRIPMSPRETEFEAYIDPHPQTPRDLTLPFLNFLYRETLMVPGYNYGINLTRTPQLPQTPTENVSIIFDIDVFTIQPFAIDNADLSSRLAEMRWLKNKSFFGSITSKVLEDLK